MTGKEPRPWPDWDRKLDPELWDDYEESMIEPGWAGVLYPNQVAYIRGVILRKIANKHRRSDMRSWWGFRRGSGHYVSEAAIRAVAMWGDPDDKEHNAELVRQAAERDREGDGCENPTSRIEERIAGTRRDLTTPGPRDTTTGVVSVCQSGTASEVRGWKTESDGRILELAGRGLSGRAIARRLSLPEAQDTR